MHSRSTPLSEYLLNNVPRIDLLPLLLPAPVRRHELVPLDLELDRAVLLAQLRPVEPAAKVELVLVAQDALAPAIRAAVGLVVLEGEDERGRLVGLDEWGDEEGEDQVGGRWE